MLAGAAWISSGRTSLGSPSMRWLAVATRAAGVTWRSWARNTTIGRSQPTRVAGGADPAGGRSFSAEVAVWALVGPGASRTIVQIRIGSTALTTLSRPRGGLYLSAFLLGHRRPGHRPHYSAGRRRSGGSSTVAGCNPA